MVTVHIEGWDKAKLISRILSGWLTEGGGNSERRRRHFLREEFDFRMFVSCVGHHHRQKIHADSNGWPKHRTQIALAATEFKNTLTRRNSKLVNLGESP